jgi:hypothetical protein
MVRRFVFESGASALALAVTSVLAGSAFAQTPSQIWTATTSGNWSDQNNWTPQFVPSGDPGTILQFDASGSSNYAANQDISEPFSLLGLMFNSSSSNKISLTNAGLGFQTSGSFITQMNSGAVEIDNNLTLNNTSSGNDVFVNGGGSGTVTLAGQITGSGGITVSNYNNTYVYVTGTSNTFGNGLTAGVQVSSPTATMVFTQNTGTPWGATAGVEVSAGTLALTPGGSGQDVLYSSATVSTTGGALTANAGGFLLMDKGSNNSLTLRARFESRTVGGSSSGTLVIIPGSGINALGTATGERIQLLLNQANVNGIVNPNFVAQASKTDTTADFLNFNLTETNGLLGFFKTQSYTNYNSAGGAFTTSSAGTEISNVLANTTAAANASIDSIRVTNANLTVNNGVTLTLKGGNTSGIQTGMILNGGTVSGPGTLFIGTNAAADEFDVYTSADNGTISAKIQSGNTGATRPAMVKFGPGRLLLTNTSNTFGSGGIISLYGGYLAINGPGGNNDATVLGTGARSILIRGGGFEVINGDYAPAASTKTFTIGTGGASFKVDDTSTLNLSQTGQFAPVAGAGPVFKTGTGSFILGGNYAMTGLTALVTNQGTWLINGTTTVAVPAVVNNSGVFGGTGTIVGTLLVNPGGTVSPGQGNTIGKFTSGAETFMAGGVYKMKYNPVATTPTAGTDNDLLFSSSTLDLTNLSAANRFTLDLEPTSSTIPDFSPVTYVIGQYSSILLPPSVTGPDITALFNFTGIYQGAPTVTISGGNLDVNFIPGAVPEPGTLALVGAGAAFGLLRRRGRRSAS